MKLNRLIKILVPCLILGIPYAHAETVTVSAAASLTNAFKEIGLSFEAANPGTTIEFNFAASGVLLQQIAQGAPADVFASADQETMDKAVAQGSIKKETRTDFAGNELVLIVPKQDAIPIGSLKDLLKPEIRNIALGNPSTTPNGRYARAVLQSQDLWDSIENKFVLAENVRQSLNYVGRGEVGAGFVFSTDAQQDQDKVSVALTVPTVRKDEQSGKWVPNPIIYPIAEVAHSRNPQAAKFIAHVLSPDGQKVLQRYGFTPVQQ